MYHLMSRLMIYWLVNSSSEEACFNGIPFKHQDFHYQTLGFILTCKAQLIIAHEYSTSSGPLRWSCWQWKSRTSLSHAGIMAGENCMFNEAAVGAVMKTTTALKPFLFYLWWLQVVLGGSLLSHSGWQLIRCRGLKVNASSRFIYGSSLGQNGAISLPFPRAGHESRSKWAFDDRRESFSGGLSA